MRLEAIEKTIAEALEGVATLDEDRILRRFLNAVRCSLRTNYWLDKEWISFKVDSRAIDELPAPRPLVEIFVYSPRMEGIHLRGGRVARGGIRWSDRREDFRTEILGLMKTQIVKNAVIVPTGSKGGFYVKRPPVGGTREQAQAEGIACYQTLIRGLLDITDNYVEGGIAPPANVVRHDGDDPYLVVAADKGTATFSDIANALARDYGFWLDDAFASGGSAGYDHKKMGITARGAWESVKRHFRELGTDIQRTPFTVVGVGDMSGDVFGNGMLLSKETKLLAAFDHRHIFIDPAPDPALSWVERKRLFDLPRSSWMDYDRKLISAGGGVYDRTAKSIALSDEARTVLGIDQPATTPVDLMRAILKAPVDLLYFGGIGTYVKASTETNADAGDRASDPLRIDASDVRAKVVGEGANLGFTQRGRVEAALAGRKINTDALDNSAGVDTSDHEVNIKIAISGPRGGQTEGRDALLFGMTDEVADLVLRDNYQQSQAISVAEAQAAEEHDRLERFMRALERQGRLDRAVEFLPDPAAMRARGLARQYLTRPELSVLLAYAKIDLTDEILDSDLPDDPLLEGELLRYFPTTLQQKFEPQLRSHRLRREIATLQVVNSLVNRCGPTFVRTVGQRTGAPAADDRPRLRRGARRLEAARPVGRGRGARSRPQGRGADPHAGRLAALPAARGAMDPAPPAAADRHHGRHRAARRRRGGAGRSAVLADRRGREHGAQRARRGLRGAGRAARHRATGFGAGNPGGGRRPHAGGAGPTAAPSRRRRGSISSWASGCRSPGWKPLHTSCRATASGRRRRRSRCSTSWRRCTPTCWARRSNCRATRIPPCSAGARAASSRSSGSIA